MGITAHVGLTGAMGAGKSTLLGMLAERGAVAFSADEAVHRAYRRRKILEALAVRYGRGILGRDGEVDRRRLAAKVAGEGEELTWLEGLVHPLVLEELKEVVRRAPDGSVVVSEVPLLAETAGGEVFDLVVSVEAPYQVRAERSGGRIDAATFRGLDGRQATADERSAVSDMIFLNEGGMSDLAAFADQVFRRALEVVRGKMREREEG